jgi:hypothetical protein
MTYLDTDAGRALFATHLRLLTAASRLRQFTLTELAEHAGVGQELARSFLRRSSDVERVDTQLQEGRGRPKNLWRLRPDRVLPVAAEVAKVSRLIEPLAAESDDDPKTWQLLQSTLTGLEKQELTDAEVPRVLHRAEMYLASAEMELRDRTALALPIPAEEQEAVRVASLEIQRLRAVTSQPKLLLLWHKVLRPARELRDKFRLFLKDWTASIPVPAVLEPDVARGQLAAHGAPGILDLALQTAARESVSDSVFVPALTMLHHKSGWDAATQAVFATDIERRLCRAAVADHPLLVTALAAAAAAFDVGGAVEPLLEQLLRRRPGGLSPEWRRICMQSLARFASYRPSSPNPELAGSACHFLLTRPGVDPFDVPLLTAAALSGRHVDEGSLLHGFGRTLYVDKHSHDLSSPSDDGAMTRNLGMAIARDSFGPLQRQIDNLMAQREYGSLMITKLCEPGYDAIKLDDTDGDEAFVVCARPLLAQCMGLVNPVHVPLRVNPVTADRLSRVISNGVWTRPPSGSLGLALRAPARLHA